LFYDAVIILKSVTLTVGSLANNKLDNIWKESVVA